MTLNVVDDLPECTAVGSNRGSVVLSTFYSSEGQIARVSTSTSRDDTSDSDSESDDKQETGSQGGQSNQAFDKKEEDTGVFVA